MCSPFVMRPKSNHIAVFALDLKSAYEGDNNKHHKIQEIIRDYLESLYSNKFENFGEINKYLETYNHPKLNQMDTNHLNRSITQNEI
jgi:hypothetical protein